MIATQAWGVKLTEEGKILIKCWAGCSLEAILTALKLDIADLFPDSSEKPDYRRQKPLGKSGVPKFSRYDLFPKLVFEASILSVAIADMLAGFDLSEADLARVKQAQDTILELRSECDS